MVKFGGLGLKKPRGGDSFAVWSLVVLALSVTYLRFAIAKDSIALGWEEVLLVL